MSKFRRDQQVWFRARGGRRFAAVITDPRIRGGKVEIQLVSDPFPVVQKVSQLTTRKGDTMPTTTRKPVSKARQLRQDAKALGIEGYESMTGDDLVAAVKAAKAPNKRTGVRKVPREQAAASAERRTARKAGAKKASAPRKSSTRPAATKRSTTKATKAPARKAPAKRTSVPPAAGGPNPFRPHSNLHIVTDSLLKGGKRSDQVKALKKAIKINPWSHDEKLTPAEVEKAIDKRLLLTSGMLVRDYGFTEEREGRGITGTIKVVPPNGRASSNGSKTKASAKKAPAKRAPAAKATKSTKKTARKR